LVRNLRARGAIRSVQRGRIEVDRLRLAAAACECHDTMRLEVEEIISINMPDLARWRVSGVESGDAI